MSDLTDRLRGPRTGCTCNAWSYMECGCDDADWPEMHIAQAADALEAAEAELARLEHQLQQAEEATTAAYKDAETAEAKLAAIDALIDEYVQSTTVVVMGHWSQGRHDTLAEINAILYPEEEQ